MFSVNMYFLIVSVLRCKAVVGGEFQGMEGLEKCDNSERAIFSIRLFELLILEMYIAPYFLNRKKTRKRTPYVLTV